MYYYPDDENFENLTPEERKNMTIYRGENGEMLQRPNHATIFSVPRFIPLLSERIRSLNPYTRQFLVQWISVLDSLPDIELVAYLPDYLDGLFSYLSDNNMDVRVATLNVLSEFLREIRQISEIQSHQKKINKEKQKDLKLIKSNENNQSITQGINQKNEQNVISDQMDNNDELDQEQGKSYEKK